MVHGDCYAGMSATLSIGDAEGNDSTATLRCRDAIVASRPLRSRVGRDTIVG
jgi:hypothetical protein